MNDQGSTLILCGVPLSGTLVPDGGLKFIDLRGWWGLPPARGRPANKPGAHGAYRRRKLLREGRVITVTGEIRTDTNAELQAARDTLEAALAAGAGEAVLVSSSNVRWRRQVEVEGLEIDPDHGRSNTFFTVDLFAPDPRRYGDVQEVGPIALPTIVGGMKLPQALPWHFGSMSAESTLKVTNPDQSILLQPEIVVNGGFSSLTVIDATDGKRLVIDWAAGVEQEVVFDCGRRRAFLDGVDVTRWMSRKQWFGIEAGSTHTFRFEVNDQVGDPRMRARFSIGAW